MKLSEIKLNPRNPQKFKDLQGLINSVEQFPKMFKYRPIVVDTDGTVLGGNKRLVVLQKLGFKEIPDSWVRFADDLTEAEKKRFIVADNVGFGEWDFQILEEDYDSLDLAEWGLELPETFDYSDKNQEIDIDEMDTEMVIKLKYNDGDYQKVKEALSKIASSPEQAVFKLLRL